MREAAGSETHGTSLPRTQLAAMSMGLGAPALQCWIHACIFLARSYRTGECSSQAANILKIHRTIFLVEPRPRSMTLSQTRGLESTHQLLSSTRPCHPPSI